MAVCRETGDSGASDAGGRGTIEMEMMLFAAILDWMDWGACSETRDKAYPTNLVTRTCSSRHSLSQPQRSGLDLGA